MLWSDAVAIVALAAAILVTRLASRSRMALAAAAALAAGWSLSRGMWQAAPVLGVAVLVTAALALPLARRRWLRRVGLGAALIGLAAAVAPYWLFPRFDLPLPDGRHPVGTREFALIDTSRHGVLESPADAPRRLLLRVWYPARDVAGHPVRPYFTAAEVRDLAPTLAENFGFPRFLYGHFGTVGTNSHDGAPVAAAGGGRWPVLIFNHGYWCWPGQNSALMEKLASHGYIVFSIGHPLDAATLSFPDGTLIPPSPARAAASVPTANMLAFWTAPTMAARMAAWPLYRADFDRHRVMRSFDAWRADTRFVMAALRSGALPPAIASIARAGDLVRIGQVGMSFGGSTAASVCHDDAGCPGAVNLDGEEFDWRLYNAAYGKPLLLIHSDWVRYGGTDAPADPHYTQDDLAYEPWRTAGRDAAITRVRIRDIRHLGLTDLPLSARRPARDRFYGALDPDNGLAAVNDLTLAFFDRAMRRAPDRMGAVIAAHPVVLPHDPATGAAMGGRSMSPEPIRKPIAALSADLAKSGLKRSLTAGQLVLMGIGVILGAGVYVMTGTAAANYAGPAVVLSFAIAGFACALVGLCYAELAAALPVAGSSYSYCYAALGRPFAWALGWLLLFEYSVSSAALAVGFAGYLVSLFGSAGVIVPAAVSSALIQSQTGSATRFAVGSGVNVIAAAAIVAAAAVLVRGVSESARVNAVLVAIKVAVLVIFVAVGVHAIDSANWTPFVPASEGGFRFGWAGVLRGTSMLFFAYIGFETVSTAAAETRDPQRSLPIGILGSLVICTLIYVVVAAVLVGVAPYRILGTADPIAVAVDRMGAPGLAVAVKLGALTGLASVLLVNAYGQSRMGFAIARDGLLPAAFMRLHPRWLTPWRGIALFAAIAAVLAATLPIGLLGDMVSMGVALAFSIVCVSVMWLRTTQPDLPRPFRVPLGGFRVRGIWIGYVPLAGIVMCWLMILPVAIDIVVQAMRGAVIPLAVLSIYGVAGWLVYRCWGSANAERLGR